MKVLIYENPFEHTSRITPDLFKCLAGFEVITAEEFGEVDKELSEGKVDYVFIHHSSNDEIDFLKIKYSQTKYIAYS